MFLAAGALAATLLSAITFPQAASGPDPTVTVVTANGSGCPQGTATAQVQPDGSSFTIDFSGYFATAGDGASPTAFRRNCQFVLDITRPEGMTYAVKSASFSGFALLNQGVTGLQAASYYFQGRPTTAARSHRFAGPFADTWQSTDTFAPGELVFASCQDQRLLNLNTELRLTPQPAAADLNAMIIDPAITVGLAWRPCA